MNILNLDGGYLQIGNNRYFHFCYITLFQQSSGIFSHLASTIASVIPSDPTPDLQPDALNALSALMLAQAQDCFVRKAISGKSLISHSSCLELKYKWGITGNCRVFRHHSVVCTSVHTMQINSWK